MTDPSPSLPPSSPSPPSPNNKYWSYRVLQHSFTTSPRRTTILLLNDSSSLPSCNFREALMHIVDL